MSYKLSSIVLGAVLGFGTPNIVHAFPPAAEFTTAPASENAERSALVEIAQMDNTPFDGPRGGGFGDRFDGKGKWNDRCNPQFERCHHRPGRHNRQGRWNGPNHARDRFDFDNDFDFDDDFEVRNRARLHIRYCLKKYRSYDPQSNTWLARAGKVRRCHSPYM